MKVVILEMNGALRTIEIDEVSFSILNVANQSQRYPTVPKTLAILPFAPMFEATTCVK